MLAYMFLTLAACLFLTNSHGWKASIVTVCHHSELSIVLAELSTDLAAHFLHHMLESLWPPAMGAPECYPAARFADGAASPV